MARCMLSRNLTAIMSTCPPQMLIFLLFIGAAAYPCSKTPDQDSCVTNLAGCAYCPISTNQAVIDSHPQADNQTTFTCINYNPCTHVLTSTEMINTTACVFSQIACRDYTKSTHALVIVTATLWIFVTMCSAVIFAYQVKCDNACRLMGACLAVYILIIIILLYLDDYTSWIYQVCLIVDVGYLLAGLCGLAFLLYTKFVSRHSDYQPIYTAEVDSL